MAQKHGHIRLVTVGKIKDKHWLAAQADYVKRLAYYTNFELSEVKDSIGKGLPDKSAVIKEGQLLQQKSDGYRRILLTEHGKTMSSPKLAKWLQTQLETHGKLAFLLAGPVGFDQATINASQEKLSLSPLTFPHEMARIICLEQLYRSFTIMNGEKYHK